MAAAAARIVAQAHKAHPADEILRRELKALGSISPDLARQLSRAVFSYFRWKGWLDETRAVSDRVRDALRLADRYAMNPGSFKDSELVQRTVPAWVGEELQITSAWARSLQAEPRLWLRARVGKGRVLARSLESPSAAGPSLEQPMGRKQAHVFGEGSLEDIVEYCGNLDLFRTPVFHKGDFEIQDISSQAVGLICSPQAGETWWDACAGEGGKTLHLSDLMQNRGLIWASDRAEWRLRKLKRRAARAGVFNYRLASWDGRQRLPTRTLFDGVLVDAPCSGLGTWHRNPHARWTTSRQDVRELAELQKRLLLHASRAVKRGGKLIYAVCTLTRAETHEVVEAFEASGPELEPLPVANPLKAGALSEHGVFIRGEEFGGNGMFIAAWRRRLPDHKRNAWH